MQNRPFDVRVEVERRIDAPVDLLYSLIADYYTHHPAILPPAISNLTVEEGGIGEGTVISFDLRFGGRTRRARARVIEPQPDVLQEIDLEFGAVTTFEVASDGGASRVTIRTEFPSAPGIQGWFERRFAPGMLRKQFAIELANLDAYARQLPSAAMTTALAH